MRGAGSPFDQLLETGVYKYCTTVSKNVLNLETGVQRLLHAGFHA